MLDDMEIFGFFFESIVTRDLRVYTAVLNGDVYHYRDNTRLEIDCIIKLADGRGAAVEVKVGGSKLDEAATNLLKLRDRIDTVNMKKPEFLMVPDGMHT